MSVPPGPRDESLFLLLQSTHRMVMRYDPEIGHLFVPNLKARIPSERGGYLVRTNAQGFRSDAEFAPRRSGGRPRIIFFGDSFTAGDGCENGERFTDLLAERLGAETFNYAVSGTGTDQQLLIFRKFAREVEADLAVLCIWVENIERIRQTHRLSIERTSGRLVRVPKPWFALEGASEGMEELRLRGVPVPRERPAADPAAGAPGGMKSRLREAYRANPGLLRLGREVQERFPGLWRGMLRGSGVTPYEDYLSPGTPGWRLMRAIVETFAREIAPRPLLIVPIPEHRYYLRGAEPLYQPLFESLAAPERGVHVTDVTKPLTALSFDDRKRLAFERDPHFSPFGHDQVAELLAGEIERRGLLPRAAKRPAPAEAAAAAPGPRASRPLHVLGLSCFYHNSAAALVRDGEIVAAAEEERFTRLKNDRRFPHLAANYCLEEAGIGPRELDAVVYYDQAPLTFERLLHTQLANGEAGEEAWQRVLPSWVRYKLHLPQLIRRYLRYEGPVLHDVHHRSHAASAFYPSPFERSAVLTIDGVGEWATASIGAGRGREVRLLKEMRFPHSLGLLYSAFTQFTGFRVNSGEYKMMGLAPYGEPRYVDAIREHLVDLKEDGSVELRLDRFAFLAEPTMTNERFAALFGGPARGPDERITRREMDLARSVQAVTEEAMLRMARTAHRLTGEANLCMAGGVVLNCVANGRILREGPFERLWIQPAAGDAGCALGAALDAYHTWFERPRELRADGRSPQGGSCLGPAFSEEEIEAFLETHGYPYRRLEPAERAATLAELLRDGKVVGHFAGREEYGPRALGSRSIVGDARNLEMQATLNLKIKYRESFRPFAPTVLAERVSDYFELDRESPYMLLVAPVAAGRRKPFRLAWNDGEDMLPIVRRPRSDIPAVTHVDYSARVQTIHRDDHPLYHDMIAAFERLTGYGVIVNTSFNVRGEPIVLTPFDAYRCFMRTEMDALALGHFLLEKRGQPPWPEAKGHVEHDPPEAPPPQEAEFARALGELFRERFLPAARAIAAAGGGRIAAAGGGARAATAWTDYTAAQTREAIFVIPAALDRASPDPAEAAAALAACWTPGPVTEALLPVTRELLALGLRFRPPAGEEPAEKVSDAIYVLY